MIGGIVLAAGAGRRFGGPKQLARLHGRPLLEYAIEAQCRVPAIERIVVVLGSRAEEVRREVDFLDAEPLVCADWSEGLAASLRAGVEAMEDADAVVVTLGDQPGITAQVVAMIVECHDSPGAAARAVYDGRPGHPVLLKRTVFPLVGDLRGDAGARSVLEQVRVREIEAAQLCNPLDIDTPADLEALAAAT